MSLIIYNKTDISRMVCKYAKALYRSCPIPSKRPDLDKLCPASGSGSGSGSSEEFPVDGNGMPIVWDWVANGDPPLPWGMGDILNIMWDPLAFLDENCEPETLFIEGILGGPLDKPSAYICPVVEETGFSGDAGLLRKEIAYYHHFQRARTYYIDVCAGSKLYIAYLVYLQNNFPAQYSYPDLSFLTTLNIDGYTVNNVYSPSFLLNEWKNPFPPNIAGPSFSDWLYNYTNNTILPCYPDLNLDLYDFIVPFFGTASCLGSTSDDSWWTGTSSDFSVVSIADKAIAGNLGAANSSIDVGETKFIIDSLENIQDPIVAHRINWQDVWYPFINFLPMHLNDFSSSIGIVAVQRLENHNIFGPKVTTGSNLTCINIGACCVGDEITGYECFDNQIQCFCDTRGGLFSEGVGCDPDPCPAPPTPTPTETPTATPTPTPTATPTPTEGTYCYWTFTATYDCSASPTPTWNIVFTESSCEYPSSVTGTLDQWVNAGENDCVQIFKYSTGFSLCDTNNPSSSCSWDTIYYPPTPNNPSIDCCPTPTPTPQQYAVFDQYIATYDCVGNPPSGPGWFVTYDSSFCGEISSTSYGNWVPDSLNLCVQRMAVLSNLDCTPGMDLPGTPPYTSLPTAPLGGDNGCCP